MQDTIQRRILDALLITLKPLARALLRAGIGHREFNEISKSAFVDVSTKDYGLRGRPTNISRVAVMTGLTRKEVRRLRDKSAAGEESFVVRSTPMSIILHRWYTDGEFLSESGEPLDLNFEGEGASFSTLVQKHGGDIPPGAMRTELKRINAVEETTGGKLKVLKRNVSSLGVHDRLVNALVNQVHPAALAAAHNVWRDDDAGAWIQRSVTTSNIRRSDLNRVKRISSDRLVEFTDSVDDLFAAYETLYESDSEEEKTVSIGVGVFYFEEDKSDSDIFP